MKIGCPEWGTLLRHEDPVLYSWPLEVQDPDGWRCCWTATSEVCSEPIGVVPLPEFGFLTGFLLGAIFILYLRLFE